MTPPLPKPYRIDVLAAAKAELAEILTFYKPVDPAYGAEIVSRLIDAADTLTFLPYRYQAYRTNRVAVRVIRAVPCVPHRIFYRVRERAAVVEVLAFRHTARRPPMWFPAK